jgi:hypothetical protein
MEKKKKELQYPMNFQLDVEFSNEMNFHHFIRKFKPKEHDNSLYRLSIKATIQP